MPMTRLGRWALFSGSMIFVVIAIRSLYTKGVDGTMIGCAVFFGACALVALFQPRLEAFTRERQAGALCRITDQGFAFDRGYAFPFGAMKGRKLLPFAEVQEVRLNTFPPTALVNGNELIFLTGLKKEDVRSAAEQHGVNTREPLDIWELIGEEFLDTEFETDHQEHTLRLLAEAGVPTEEVRAIRKKLRWSMLLWAYASLEWIYCGHYDVLANRSPVRSSTYWWTMGIALRERPR